MGTLFRDKPFIAVFQYLLKPSIKGRVVRTVCLINLLLFALGLWTPQIYARGKSSLRAILVAQELNEIPAPDSELDYRAKDESASEGLSLHFAGDGLGLGITTLKSTASWTRFNDEDEIWTVELKYNHQYLDIFYTWGSTFRLSLGGGAIIGGKGTETLVLPLSGSNRITFETESTAGGAAFAAFGWFMTKKIELVAMYRTNQYQNKFESTATDNLTLNIKHNETLSTSQAMIGLGWGFK